MLLKVLHLQRFPFARKKTNYFAILNSEKVTVWRGIKSIQSEGLKGNRPTVYNLFNPIERTKAFIPIYINLY